MDVQGFAAVTFALAALVALHELVQSWPAGWTASPGRAQRSALVGAVLVANAGACSARRARAGPPAVVRTQP